MSHKYRKRPIVITARAVTAASISEVATWCGGTIQGPICPDGDRAIAIDTREGTLHAEMGDWIIKGVKGEFYPVKPDIFAATHEPAGEEYEIGGIPEADTP